MRNGKAKAQIDSDPGLFANLVDACHCRGSVEITPENVWLAITSQLSLYLGSSPLPHDDKLRRTLADWKSLHIASSAVHGGLVTSDSALPEIRVQGTAEDYGKVLSLLDTLRTPGAPLVLVAWYHLLHIVVSRFLECTAGTSFTRDDEFWHKTIRARTSNDDVRFVSGWAAALRVFDKDGRWIGYPLDETAGSARPPKMLTGARFWATYGGDRLRYCGDLVLDGVPFHRVYEADWE